MARILVACEESQVVTIALREAGHQAWSCDIQECSGGHPEWHIQDDVTRLLKKKWDGVIAFPPCTHLSNVGASTRAMKLRNGQVDMGAKFFMACINANASRVAVENPIGIMSRLYKKPTQVIQPYQYGHDAQKATCLWLKGLPKLTPTCITDVTYKWIPKYAKGTKNIVSWQCESLWFYKARTSGNSSLMLSKTFPGVAKAMASQWSDYFSGKKSTYVPFTKR